MKLRKTLEKGRASAAQIEETVAQKRVVLEEKLADSIAKSAKEREGMLADLAPFEEAARASDTLAASTALELRILREMDPIERMRLEHMRERERSKPAREEKQIFLLLNAFSKGGYIVESHASGGQDKFNVIESEQERGIRHRLSMRRSTN